MRCNIIYFEVKTISLNKVRSHFYNQAQELREKMQNLIAMKQG